MFLGQFTTTFSGKNRIILPKKLRQELRDENIYLILGFDGGIWGFRTEDWVKEAGKRLEKELLTTLGRRERRIFFSSAEKVSLDGQGRFILPEAFSKRAELTEQIVIIGAGDHFEVWNPELYQKVLKNYGSTTGD